MLDLTKLEQFFKKYEVESKTPVTRWINDDIKPIEAGRRTWTSWTFHNYWAVSNTNISVYLTGSALIALGLNWWQAIIAIVVGTLIATVAIVYNSLAGGYYNIGFPVANRYVWGMYGSQFVIWNRIFLSIVWYGFQAWIGAECFYVCMMAIDPNIEQHIPNHMPASTGMTTAQFVAYIIFSILVLPIVWIRPHKLEKFLLVSTLNITIFMVVLLIWSLSTMGGAGFGSTLTAGTNLPKGTSLGWMMVYGVISTIGSVAAAILNQNDFARFARRPRDAILGQAFSFPFYNIVCSIIGILVTAATQQRFGAALWNLPDIFTTLIQNGGGRERAASFFAGLSLVLSQLAIGVPTNALAGGFDLAATFPRYINIRRGAYLTVLISPAVNPWRLVETQSVFLAVMACYSVFLGPMVGIMIASYFTVNKQKINVPDLYIGNKSSIYWHTWGVNWRAPVAWFCGVAPSFPGFLAAVDLTIIVPVGFVRLYYICFVSGFCISAFVYVALHYLFPASKIQVFVKNDSTSKELMAENRQRIDDEGSPHNLIEGITIGVDDHDKTTTKDLEVLASK